MKGLHLGGLATALLLLLTGVASAPATLLFHEEFDGYAAGSIVGQTGKGLGMTGNWSQPSAAGTYTLGPGLSGGNAIVVNSTGTGDNNLQINHTVAGWGTGQMWMSYLYNEVSYGGHAYLSGGPVFAGAFGHPWSSDFGIDNTTGPGNVPYSYNHTYRLVALIDWNAGTTTMWVDPDPNTTPVTDPLATGFAPAAYKTEVQSQTRTLVLAFYGTDGTVDDIRIGTTYGDVVLPMPTVPQLTAPPNGAVGISPSPVLQWSANGATDYKVFLWADGSPKPGTPTAAGLAASSYSPALPLAVSTIYRWMVVADNSTGSLASAEATFTTSDGHPAAPATPSPANGAANVLVDTTLDWADSAGATGYQVYLWLSGNSRPATPTAMTVASSYTPPSALAPNTNYNWQVVATNLYGSTTGAVWAFSTGERSPGYLVPWPASVTMRSGDFPVTASTRIVAANASLLRLAWVMTNDFYMAAGLRLAALQGTPQAGDIVLTNNTSLSGEAYTLDVNSSNIVLSGSNYQAVAWASVTLLQALNTSNSPATVPQMLIQDQPAAPLRTVMWDIARFWHPLETLYELVDLHRMYKVAYLHLSMSANGLFTFGTTAFPLLTRTADNTVPYYGGAGFYLPPNGSRLYYTKAELTNLVQYATDRGVVIVPQIDTPNWASYMTSHDPADFCSVGGATTTYYVNYSYTNAMSNMAVLMGELADVFNTTPYIHIGADEVDSSQFTTYPYWAQSAALNNWANGDEGMVWYMNRLSADAASRGKTTWAWTGPSKVGKGYDMPTNMVYTAWGYDDGQGPSATGYWVMRAGGMHIATMAQANNAPPYNRCLEYRPAEGIYNRLLPLKRYIGGPDGIWSDLTPSFLPLTGTENKILGAHIMEWETPYDIELPAMRLSLPALAEPTWSQNTNLPRLNWDSFLVRQGHADQLYQRLMRPVVLSVTTQVDPKDICFVAGGMVTMTSAVPGTIRYTVGTDYNHSWYNFPTTNSTAYTGPFAISQSSVVSARLFDTNGQPLGNPVTRGFYLITPTTHYKYYYTGDPAPTDFESGIPIVSSVMGQMNGNAPQEDVRWNDTLHRTVYTAALNTSSGAYTFTSAYGGGAIYIDRGLVPDGVATALTAGEHLVKIVTPASTWGTPYTFTGPGHSTATDINVLLKTLATASQVFPASYAFGTQATGGATDVQLVTIINHNVFTNMIIASVALAGANASDFAISADTGEPVLAPGAERVVGVRFAPATTGAKTATLHVVASILPGGSADVALTGTASLGPPPAPVAPMPTNGAVGVDPGTALDWADSSTASGYSVFLWLTSQSKPATPTANVVGSSYDPPGSLLLGTNYSWQVVATNSAGATAGAVWTFTTSAVLPPFSLAGISLQGGVPTFAIANTIPSSQYTLFYKDHLTDAAWIPLSGSGTAPGNGGTLVLTDPTVPGSLPANRFYRVQRNP